MIVLIDAAIYAHLAYHAERADSRANDGIAASEDPGLFYTGPRFVSMIRALLDELQPTHGIAAWNGPGDRQWRRREIPSYKANRPPLAPGLRALLHEAPTLLEADGLRSVALDEYEADDVIASYAAQVADCVIVSNDKDFYQVLGVNGTRIWDPRKVRAPKGVLGFTAPAPGTWITLEDVREKFGVDPCRVVDVQALMGDSADGVTGCPGIGPAGASNLITVYGSLRAVLDAPRPLMSVGALPKLLDKVHANRTSVEEALRLVTLARDLQVPLPVPTINRPALEGVGRFFGATPMPSPFEKLFTPAPPVPAVAPPPAPPSLKDQLNTQAAAEAGVAAPPPAPPVPSGPSQDAINAVSTAARAYATRGNSAQKAREELAPWASATYRMTAAELGEIVARIYTEVAHREAAPPPVPAGPPAPPTPSEKVRAWATRLATSGTMTYRQVEDETQRFAVSVGGIHPGEVSGIVATVCKAHGVAIEAKPDALAECEAFMLDRRATGISRAQTIRDALVKFHGRLSPDQVHGLSEKLQNASEAEEPPAPPVSINPPDGVPADEPATEYAPGGAADPKTQKNAALLVPPGFGEWSGRTWTSLVKDQAGAFWAALQPHAPAGYTFKAASGAEKSKRSELLEDCRALVELLPGGLPEAASSSEVAPPPVPAPAVVRVELTDNAGVVAALERAASDLAGLAAADQHAEPPPPVPPKQGESDQVRDPLPGVPRLGALFIDCTGIGYASCQMVRLSQLVEREGWGVKVAAELGVQHYGIADYRKGARGIAAYLDAYLRSGDPSLSATWIVVDSRLDYAPECLSVLEQAAGFVVKRLG